MKHITAIVLAVGALACGGDDTESDLAHPDAKPTDYIDVETLDLAENEAQEICLISGFVASARYIECDFEGLREGPLPTDEEIVVNCQRHEMPVSQSLLQDQDCHLTWAQAKCEALVGPRSDAAQPELCRIAYDPNL